MFSSPICLITPNFRERAANGGIHPLDEHLRASLVCQTHHVLQRKGSGEIDHGHIT